MARKYRTGVLPLWSARLRLLLGLGIRWLHRRARRGEGSLLPLPSLRGRQVSTERAGESFGVFRPFALLQRRVGSRRASHPSPPPSGHQSTNLPASKRALKVLQRMLTTLNGHYVRLGSQSSPVGASPPPFRPDLWINRVGAPITPIVRAPASLCFLMGFQSTSKARRLW